MNSADKLQLELLVEDYRKNFCGLDWHWRKQQKEIILSILESYYDPAVNTVIAECPTGSGKSHIAMCVSWVLSEQNKKGYILASDISLQDQYEEDIFKMNIRCPSIKGVDRYTCSLNDEVVSMGQCRMLNKAPKSMACFSTCPYYSARNAAGHSNIALLNYSYWLIQMNYVKNNSPEPLFFERDFTICDEAHKITELVQNHFAPRFNKPIITDKLKKIKKYFQNEIKSFSFDDEFEKAQRIFDALFNTSDSLTTLKLLYHLNKQLDIIADAKTVLDSYIDVCFVKMKLRIPPSVHRMHANFNFFKDINCKTHDFIEIIKQSGLNNLIRSKISKDEFILYCLEEKYLMEKYFHEQKNFTVYLSATIGNIEEYMRDMNISSAKVIKMSSGFDFSKSPIYFYNKYRMSYAKMEENLPWLISKIDDIIKKYPDEKGIIHTASYDLTLKIFNALSIESQKRIIVYSGSEEKQQGLDSMWKEGNQILIGPSLIEGVNLPDDKCRFLIFAKVPYLSLGDDFVKAKFNKNGNWYKSKAIIAMLQGVGRGVRSETDYCDTYILDANFADLLDMRTAFPYEFISRIRLQKSDY